MKDLDNKKMPIFLKIIIAGVPIILIIVYLIFTTNRDLQNREQFFIQEFSSVVISSNNSSTGRSIEFHLSNGLKIYFGHSISGSIKVGDSIRKAPNTYVYDVYRKDINGQYQFLATYHFQKTL